MKTMRFWPRRRRSAEDHQVHCQLDPMPGLGLPRPPLHRALDLDLDHLQLDCTLAVGLRLDSALRRQVQHNKLDPPDRKDIQGLRHLKPDLQLRCLELHLARERGRQLELSSYRQLHRGWVQRQEQVALHQSASRCCRPMMREDRVVPPVQLQGSRVGCDLEQAHPEVVAAVLARTCLGQPARYQVRYPPRI